MGHGKDHGRSEPILGPGRDEETQELGCKENLWTQAQKQNRDPFYYSNSIYLDYVL